VLGAADPTADRRHGENGDKTASHGAKLVRRRIDKMHANAWRQSLKATPMPGAGRRNPRANEKAAESREFAYLGPSPRRAAVPAERLGAMLGGNVGRCDVAKRQPGEMSARIPRLRFSCGNLAPWRAHVALAPGPAAAKRRARRPLILFADGQRTGVARPRWRLRRRQSFRSRRVPQFRASFTFARYRLSSRGLGCDSRCVAGACPNCV
jgi:hypothetical protein